MEKGKKEELIKKINESLEKVRPYLVADGGNVNFEDITDDFIVKVRLTGACHGCPFSMQTLKAGIEQAIINDVPEVKKVEAV
ncbi:MAG: NifU family protein [Bacteroidota bacterium]